jgi:uncharacterized protein DUF6152
MRITLSFLTAAVLIAMTLAMAHPTAHHAFAAEFDANKPVELRGTVTRLQWTNPHSWLYVDVPAADGTVTPWAIEFGAPYSLMQKGLRKTDFPIGVAVVVKGFRAKSGKAVANASSVSLPNGRGFYTGADDGPGEK